MLNTLRGWLLKSTKKHSVVANIDGLRVESGGGGSGAAQHLFTFFWPLTIIDIGARCGYSSLQYVSLSIDGNVG